VHLVLSLEVSQAEHLSARRHDTGIRVGHRLQPLKAAHDAADPATSYPINEGPALARYSITYCKHVLLWKMNIEIAIGVRRVRDVAVTNTGIELAVGVEGLIRLRDLGQTFETLTIPGPDDVGRQPQSRVLVGNDCGTGLGQSFVRSGLLRVPMSIEDRVNFRASGQ